ncbi:hypothetical protein [Henriciella aquimarina]|uniref:hypothetical protein n=1 Tax=Henriciella aquimarina TaxID=545261 RepID=UPI00117ACD76|nr:hypothetical protein [Henriciella aquimarina]
MLVFLSRVVVPLALGLCSLTLAPGASAQNTAGVFGPKVNPDTRLVEYRTAFVPGEDGGDDRYAHRLNGALSLDTRRMVRLVVQGSDRGGPDGFDFDYVQAELFWEVSDEAASQWQTGFRFDARLANGDRPEQIGVNWTNQFRLSDRLSARAIALSTAQFGDNAADGVLLAGRASLNYRLDNGYSLILESFNALGSTDDFGPDDRSQQVGPRLTGTLDSGWTWSLGALFGLNDSTPDNDLRLWFGRHF